MLTDFEIKNCMVLSLFWGELGDFVLYLYKTAKGDACRQ